MILTKSLKNDTAVNRAMSRVYGYMALATLLSMFVSYQVGMNQDMVQFLFTGITKWIVMFAPLIMIFIVMPFLSNNPSRIVAVLLLASFAAVMGVSLSVIFVEYTVASVFTAFLGGSVLFAIMSVYGYITKRDLSNLGAILFIALIAIIIVSLINLFIGSSLLQIVISAIAIVVFAGLTAYDTQTIRRDVAVSTSPGVEVLGALTLYLDLINLVINLLQLTGDSDK